jgi:hypothetical protein
MSLLAGHTPSPSNALLFAISILEFDGHFIGKDCQEVFRALLSHGLGCPDFDVMLLFEAVAAILSTR